MTNTLFNRLKNMSFSRITGNDVVFKQFNSPASTSSHTKTLKGSFIFEVTAKGFDEKDEPVKMKCRIVFAPTNKSYAGQTIFRPKEEDVLEADNPIIAYLQKHNTQVIKDESLFEVFKMKKLKSFCKTLFENNENWIQGKKNAIYYNIDNTGRFFIPKDIEWL